MIDDITEDPVVTIEVMTPSGSIIVMGEPFEHHRSLIVAGVHISSRGIAPNDIGFRNSRLIAAGIMDEMDYDDIRIEGEVRTTGAYPSHRPRPIRFKRNRRDPQKS